MIQQTSDFNDITMIAYSNSDGTNCYNYEGCIDITNTSLLCCNTNGNKNENENIKININSNKNTDTDDGDPDPDLLIPPKEWRHNYKRKILSELGEARFIPNISLDIHGPNETELSIHELLFFQLFFTTVNF